MSESSYSLFHPPLPRPGQQFIRWQQAPGAGMALALASAARAHRGLLVVVTRDTHTGHQLEQELTVFADAETPVMHLPDWETLPYDAFSPHADIISQRIATLYRLPSLTRGLLVVPVATLMQRLAPREFLAARSLLLEVGQQLDMDRERQRLESVGYRCVPQVLEPGDFAVRGALLDIFPMGASLPYRIELLDDEIDSLRSFDPESQRSLEKVSEVRLLPAREFPLDEKAMRAFRMAFRERFDVDTRRCSLYQDLREGTTPAGIEYYLPLFFEHTETLFDYLSEHCLLALSADAGEAAEHFHRQASERYEQRAYDLERPILPIQELYLSPEQFRQRINGLPRIEICEQPGSAVLTPQTQRAPDLTLHQKGHEAGDALVHFLGSWPGRALIAADSPGRREALSDLLSGIGLKPSSVDNWQQFVDGDASLAICVAELEDGVVLDQPMLAILTERQLYGERARQTRRRKRAGRDPDAIIRDLADLVPGAPVVHEDHGVGRYLGLVTLKVGDTPGEFLQLEYAKGDKLYVPVSALHLVSRYTGTSPENAPLHSLGGEQWTKAKRRAAEKVRDVAAEMLEIQARRQARTGKAFELDRGLYEQFAAGFPFEETPDQLAAIEAVITDLVAPRPMDRVVCGDVGFGKTEVAMRAAFVAAQAGYQVAVLVPTTLLAQQHYKNLTDRFADWPIRIEVLSRFKTPSESRRALEQVADGSTDIIVGTHRLLQADVRFKRLGLVIVDEEQRFGVRQKEKFKALRAEVDLLTLTATPIPRTLNMAMAGMRDLSLIATPPAHRLAVKTFIGQWDPAMLREAVQRELQRGGQVYFLHNEVQSIERIGRELGELLPEARIRIAHGQMAEKELEQVMLDFYRQRFNVLLCTTIIESGIDVPTANTIIMNRADKLGLAQLHQLRGRVGRSHHRAYAYLVVPHPKAMTSDAAKRLEAIASLEELGAGFTLATHDLEIRGAGELLGEDQSGQIQEIGFSLYTELLERAVRSLKAGRIPDFEDIEHHGSEVELHIPALIPDDYLPDVHTRLMLYKRIASARDEDGLRELQVEMIDRFGLLPDPVKNLFAVATIKLGASALGIRKLELGEHGGRIQFGNDTCVDPLYLIKLIQSQPRIYSMQGQDTLRFRQPLPEASDRLNAAQSLLKSLPTQRAAA